MEISSSAETHKSGTDSNEDHKTPACGLPNDQMMEFDIRKNRWTYEDENGNEYEYDEKRRTWILSVIEDVSDALMLV